MLVHNLHVGMATSILDYSICSFVCCLSPSTPTPPHILYTIRLSPPQMRVVCLFLIFPQHGKFNIRQLRSEVSISYQNLAQWLKEWLSEYSKSSRSMGNIFHYYFVLLKVFLIFADKFKDISNSRRYILFVYLYIKL